MTNYHKVYKHIYNKYPNFISAGVFTEFCKYFELDFLDFTMSQEKSILVITVSNWETLEDLQDEISGYFDIFYKDFDLFTFQDNILLITFYH